jgi:AcrR family transcriptional regulator
LQAAALDLFAAQGFERTTVLEITQRAGLTERTFFNHFADKREVLFGPISELQRDIVVEAIATADTLAPLDTVLGGLQAAADKLFEVRRDAVIRRRQLLDANPELQERELQKQALFVDAIADALRIRGLDPDTALLTARLGLVVQQTAMQRWTRQDEQRPLRELLRDALVALRDGAGQTLAP